MIVVSDYLELGIAASKSERVRDGMTVGALVPGMPLVYSTPYMITVMEIVAEASVATLLPDGWISVGTRVEVDHLKATPVGLEVTTRSELVEIGGREIRFRVTASDGFDLIGSGFHTRAVVERERFMQGVDAKLNALRSGH